MNQELKHRLIGAAVITALAAIFIPMLFDDPIDDTGQLVSELTVPPTPDQVTQAPQNKTPASIDQVLEKPAAGPGQSEQELKDWSEPPSEESEAGGLDSGTNLQERQVPLKPSQSAETNEAGTTGYVEEEMAQESDTSEKGLAQNEETSSLDTGMVEQSHPHPPTATAKAADESEKNQQPPGSNPKQKPVRNVALPPVKATINQHAATVDAAKKTAGKIQNIAKKTTPELVRYYLQAGSFGRKDNALALFEALRKQGLPVALETVQSEKGALYRLKVGPELSKKRAVDIKSRLEKQKIKAMLIAE